MHSISTVVGCVSNAHVRVPRWGDRFPDLRFGCQPFCAYSVNLVRSVIWVTVPPQSRLPMILDRWPFLHFYFAVAWYGPSFSPT